MKHALIFLIVEAMLVFLVKHSQKKLEFALSVKTKERGSNQEDNIGA
jgi:hypothetical protein